MPPPPVATHHQPVPPTVLPTLLVPLTFCGMATPHSCNQVVEYKKQYDGEGTAAAMAPCQVLEANQGATCDISFDVETEMAAPVYVYYELHNFYQNHRRYVKSRDDSQLDGQVQPESSLSDCDPLITNATSGKVLHPCGLIANSYFNGKPHGGGVEQLQLPTSRSLIIVLVVCLFVSVAPQFGF